MFNVRVLVLLAIYCLAAGCSQTIGDSSDGEHSESGGVDGVLRQASLASGPGYTCGISEDGSAICWGRDTHGEASPPEGAFSFLAVALKHGCGLDSDGNVICWGADSANETQAPVGKFTDLCTARFHTCGVRDDQTLACWGHGSDPEVDEGSIGVADDADQAVPPDGAFIQVVTGDEFSCGLRTSGELECWGKYVEYWDEDALGGPYVQIDAGPRHVCGVRSEDKGLTCWGWALGYEASEAPSGEYLQVSVNLYHACALRADHRVDCWGSGSEQGVQQEDPYDFDQALALEGEFAAVSAGKFHTCAVRKDDGTVACWGRDFHGESSPPEGFVSGMIDDNAY